MTFSRSPRKTWIFSSSYENAHNTAAYTETKIITLILGIYMNGMQGLKIIKKKIVQSPNGAEILHMTRNLKNALST